MPSIDYFVEQTKIIPAVLKYVKTLLLLNQVIRRQGELMRK